MQLQLTIECKTEKLQTRTEHSVLEVSNPLSLCRPLVDAAHWMVLYPSNHVDGNIPIKQVVHKGSIMKVVVFWCVMTRVSTQTGNSASKTERDL